jgi:microcystin-dependent protein
MSQPYIGEIRLFAGNFAPQNYAICDGSLLSIASNTALFSLLGTTYGGNGTTTFALPDLRSRVPVHQGTGQSNYVIGMSGGVENVVLSSDQMPAHRHSALASTSAASSRLPTGALPALATHPAYGKEGDSPPAVPRAMNSLSLTGGGGGQPHENRQPTLPINFIIALFGVFPSQA